MLSLALKLMTLGSNTHRAYREKVQRYSEEGKKLLEDLKHGIFLGTTEFVEKIRETFLPGSPQKEIPQCRKIQRDIDLSELIQKAALMLNIVILFCQQSKRIPKEIKEKRDMLIFCIWKTGLLTNEKIGRLSGMSYSSISHIVKSVRDRMERENGVKKKFANVYSLFKICPRVLVSQRFDPMSHQPFKKKS